MIIVQINRKKMSNFFTILSLVEVNDLFHFLTQSQRWASSERPFQLVFDSTQFCLPYIHYFEAVTHKVYPQMGTCVCDHIRKAVKFMLVVQLQLGGRMPG